MNLALKSITSYIPPLWLSLDTLDDDGSENFYKGDLVEYDDYYGDHIGVGIIKDITTHEFKDLETGVWRELPCAIVVSANPDMDFLNYVPMTHMDIMSHQDYFSLYESEYNATAEKMQQVRNSVYTKCALHGWEYGGGAVSSLFAPANPVPMGV